MPNENSWDITPEMEQLLFWEPPLMPERIRLAKQLVQEAAAVRPEDRIDLGKLIDEWRRQRTEERRRRIGF